VSIIACPNCGKLIDAADTQCFHCGAQRDPAAPPNRQESPAPPTPPRPSDAASVGGCLVGVLLAMALPIVVGLTFSRLSSSQASVYAMIVLGIIAIALIPVLLPYGRRFPVFVRWMLGTACVLLLIGLGALAACLAMLNPHMS
jgi:hypothetical protein